VHTRATRRAIPAGSESNLGVRALCLTAILGCSGLWVFQFERLFSGIESGTLLPLIAGLLLGVAAADLVTAAVHWACDTWGSEQTPWLGPSLIYSFREHHRDPSAMLDHDWLEVNGAAAAGAVIALVGYTVLSSRDMGAESWAQMFAAAFFLSAMAVSAVTNQLHYWAHAARPPSIVRQLQASGLILSPLEHVGHHRAPHTHGYCISTGWLNRPLDEIRFWRALERGLSVVTGAEPRQSDTSS
jgi:hypothetical protein